MDDAIAAWVDGYVAAWNSNDPEQVGALFAADAEYRIEPYVVPWRGRAAIVAGWLEHRDEPGDTEFEWTHTTRARDLNLERDFWILEARTRYRSLDKDYCNLWLVRLDGEGRCTEFAEWWMERLES